jgi:hypothetical protein
MSHQTAETFDTDAPAATRAEAVGMGSRRAAEQAGPASGIAPAGVEQELTFPYVGRTRPDLFVLIGCVGLALAAYAAIEAGMQVRFRGITFTVGESRVVLEIVRAFFGFGVLTLIASLFNRRHSRRKISLSNAALVCPRAASLFGQKLMAIPLHSIAAVEDLSLAGQTILRVTHQNGETDIVKEYFPSDESFYRFRIRLLMIHRATIAGRNPAVLR